MSAVIGNPVQVVAPTQASLLTALEACMATVGFILADSYASSGTEFRIFSHKPEPEYSDALGTVYLRLELTSALLLRQYVSRNWDLVAHTASNQITMSQMTISGIAGSVSFYTCLHEEVRGVFIIDGSTYRGAVGYIRPSQVYDFWIEPSYLCFSGLAPTAPFVGSCPGLHPWGSSGAATSLSDRLIDPPPVGFDPQIITSPFLFGTATGQRCVWGRFSSDIGLCPNTGYAFGYPFSELGQTYILLQPNSFGVCIRV